MAREKKNVHKVQMTDGKRQIIQQLIQEYDIETAEDIQEALKDLLGGTIKEMMEAEMDDHLGYHKSERSESDDYRNGYKTKRVNSSFGSLDIQVPQDRNSTFEPQVVKKRQKDISEIDLNCTGHKEVLTIQVGENESAKYWLSVLNELKNRGVKDIMIICADGLSGIKEAIATAFPNTEYQRCLVHQVRNTLKYVPDKDRKAFAKDLKTIYNAPTEEEGRKVLDKVTEKWEENQALLKALYLSTFEATKKWTIPLRNWGRVYGEL